MDANELLFIETFYRGGFYLAMDGFRLMTMMINLTSIQTLKKNFNLVEGLCPTAVNVLRLI